MEPELSSKGQQNDDSAPAEGGGTVKFNASPQLWTYLQWLSKHTILGKTPGEVAQQVLIQRLSEMKAEDFVAKI